MVVGEKHANYPGSGDGHVILSGGELGSVTEIVVPSRAAL
jgi:hypothetical protein